MAAQPVRGVALCPRSGGGDLVVRARQCDDLEQELILPIEGAGGDVVQSSAVREMIHLERRQLVFRAVRNRDPADALCIDLHADSAPHRLGNGWGVSGLPVKWHDGIGVVDVEMRGGVQPALGQSRLGVSAVYRTRGRSGPHK